MLTVIRRGSGALSLFVSHFLNRFRNQNAELEKYPYAGRLFFQENLLCFYCLSGYVLYISVLCSDRGYKKTRKTTPFFERVAFRANYWVNKIGIRFYLMFPTLIRYSAICTAFSAAPFLIWSPTNQKVRPFSFAKSLRTRPTYTSSLPARKSGIG